MTTESTENTVSIPGIQPSLAEHAKTMRDRKLEEADRQRQEEEVAESKRLEESKQVFLEFLDKYAGAILRRLDVSRWHPVIENATSNWFYTFRVAHTTIELVTPENIHNGHCSIGVSVKGGYFGDAGRKWIDKENLSDYLLGLVGEIIQQYQQYRSLAADLDRYNTCLQMAARRTSRDIEKDKETVWTWPDRAILKIYKITWTKGGHYDSDTRKVYLQEESGWSLSDKTDCYGCYNFLIPNSDNTRKINVSPSAIEHFSIASSEDVPTELMVTVRKGYEVVIAPEVTIHKTNWTQEQIFDYKQGIEDYPLDDLTGDDIIHIVFPEHLPKYSSIEIPNLLVSRIKHIDLGRVPCLEIRLAVEAIANTKNS